MWAQKDQYDVRLLLQARPRQGATAGGPNEAPGALLRPHPDRLVATTPTHEARGGAKGRMSFKAIPSAPPTRVAVRVTVRG